MNLKSESDKNKIFDNLSKLKGNEVYARISITEDYTIHERKLVQEMKEQVKAKNITEPDDSGFIWKLRGTPNKHKVKSGLAVIFDSFWAKKSSILNFPTGTTTHTR